VSASWEENPFSASWDENPFSSLGSPFSNRGKLLEIRYGYRKF